MSQNGWESVSRENVPLFHAPQILCNQSHDLCWFLRPTHALWGNRGPEKWTWGKSQATVLAQCPGHSPLLHLAPGSGLHKPHEEGVAHCCHCSHSVSPSLQPSSKMSNMDGFCSTHCEGQSLLVQGHLIVQKFRVWKQQQIFEGFFLFSSYLLPGHSVMVTLPWTWNLTSVS